MRRGKKHYLGVDPGKNGGLCVLHSDGIPITWERMPDGKARIADWVIREHRKYPRITLVTELAQVFPKQGLVSAFRYGMHFGTFEDAAIYLGIPYVEVRPHVWKKAMGLTSRKRDSIAACRRLFPAVDLVPLGCRTEHDGIAEALLIAEWARRKNL